MTEPTRLFDCLEYHLERKPLPDILAGKEGGDWKIVADIWNTDKE